MEKIKEILTTVKILWCFIAGLMITALFNILLPMAFSLLPCIVIGLVLLLLPLRNSEKKYDWLSFGAVILGALYIWLLAL